MAIGRPRETGRPTLPAPTYPLATQAFTKAASVPVWVFWLFQDC